MERTINFHTSYDELRTDLLEEVAMVDIRIIKPATEAKDCIQPMKKVIRKRGDKKVGTIIHQSANHSADLCLQLDFEKYQKRVETGRSKTKRSDRDNASLEKAEAELIRAKDVR